MGGSRGIGRVLVGDNCSAKGGGAEEGGKKMPRCFPWPKATLSNKLLQVTMVKNKYQNVYELLPVKLPPSTRGTKVF